MPGCSALTRTGASSHTSVRTRPETPPFDGAHRRRPGIGPLLGQAAEQHYRSVNDEARRQLVDDFGVAHQFQRHQSLRRVLVVSRRYGCCPVRSR